MHLNTSGLEVLFKGSKATAAKVYSVCLYWFRELLRRGFTVEEDEEDTRVGQLLSTQQVDVLDAEVESQLDDRPVLHVCCDVRHESQVLHQTAGLRSKTSNAQEKAKKRFLNK